MNSEALDRSFSSAIMLCWSRNFRLAVFCTKSLQIYPRLVRSSFPTCDQSQRRVSRRCYGDSTHWTMNANGGVHVTGKRGTWTRSERIGAQDLIVELGHVQSANYWLLLRNITACALSSKNIIHKRKIRPRVCSRFRSPLRFATSSASVPTQTSWNVSNSPIWFVRLVFELCSITALFEKLGNFSAEFKPARKLPLRLKVQSVVPHVRTVPAMQNHDHILSLEGVWDFRFGDHLWIWHLISGYDPTRKTPVNVYWIHLHFSFSYPRVPERAWLLRNDKLGIWQLGPKLLCRQLQGGGVPLGSSHHQAPA